MLKLAGGALDVDGLAAFASLFVSDVGVNRFADGDLDLEVKAGPVSAAGLTAQSVDTALQAARGAAGDRPAVDRRPCRRDGQRHRHDQGFPRQPDRQHRRIARRGRPRAADRGGRRAVPDNALVQGLQARAVAYRGLFEDARLDIVATAAANGDGTTGVAVSANGTAGGTVLSATLSGNGRREQAADADISIALSGRNDDATELLALYGLPVLPLGLTGPGETSFSLKGRLSGDLATSFSLTGSDFSTGFAGTAELADGGIAAKGKARLNAADIEPWLMTTSVALPAMGAGMAVELEADADYADKLLVLDGLTGAVNEGAVAGDINAVVKDGKPHLTGQLTLDELNLEPLAAMVLGEPALESTGNGWSSVPFAPKVAAPFSAELGIAAATLSAGPAITAYDASLTLRLDDESLRLSDLSGKLYGGDVTGLFELKNNDGTGLFSGQMKLSGADIASILGDAGLQRHGRPVDRAFGERQVGRRAGRHAVRLGHRGLPLAGGGRRQSACFR